MWPWVRWISAAEVVPTRPKAVEGSLSVALPDYPLCSSLSLLPLCLVGLFLRRGWLVEQITTPAAETGLWSQNDTIYLSSTSHSTVPSLSASTSAGFSGLAGGMPQTPIIQWNEPDVSIPFPS